MGSASPSPWAQLGVNWMEKTGVTGPAHLVPDCSASDMGWSHGYMGWISGTQRNFSSMTNDSHMTSFQKLLAWDIPDKTGCIPQLHQESSEFGTGWGILHSWESRMSFTINIARPPTTPLPLTLFCCGSFLNVIDRYSSQWKQGILDSEGQWEAVSCLPVNPAS